MGCSLFRNQFNEENIVGTLEKQILDTLLRGCYAALHLAILPPTGRTLIAQTQMSDLHTTSYT